MSAHPRPTVTDIEQAAQAALEGHPTQARLVEPEVEHDLELALVALDQVSQAFEPVPADTNRPPVVPGYQIKGLISRTGNSTVWLGVSPQLDHPVAIKLPADGSLDEAAVRDRILAEAFVLRSLNIPGVVPFIEVGQLSDGQTFLVTRYIEGDPFTSFFHPTDPAWTTLSVALEAASDAPSKRAVVSETPDPLTTFTQVCRIVHAAHEAGVVHRDLKPGNIRLDLDGKPWILDFGLARWLGNLQTPNASNPELPGRIEGTLPWLSPEQTRPGQAIDRRSDVYSLGVILYQLLAGGRFPYIVRGELTAVLKNITEVPPRSLADVGGRSDAVKLPIRIEVNPPLWSIVSKALEKDPARRYQTAEELAFDIERFLVGRRPRAHPRLTPRRAVTVTALVLAAALGVAMILREPPMPVPPDSFMHRLWEDPFLGHEFIYCPPGTLELGVDPETRRLMPDEHLQSIAIDSGFWIAVLEVTQAQFERVMGFNPSRYQEGPDSADRPVEFVSYRQAVEFCEKLSEMTGRRYRLPTEVEWEYACRAGTTTPWSFGSEPTLMYRFGNVADRSTTYERATHRMSYDDRHPFTAPVRSFQPNAWYLHDMHGNVWEWCAEPFLIEQDNPASALPGHAGVRGGSWHDMPYAAQSGGRNPQRIDAKYSTVGFRVVVERPAPVLK